MSTDYTDRDILTALAIIAVAAILLRVAGCATVPSEPPLKPGVGFRYEAPVRQI